jgi:hypothetical protein
MAGWDLDDVQKAVQIGFWVVSGTVVVLTYLRARKGVLSTVNSEYQKRVMDRLQKLSEDLYAEFDHSSPTWWAKTDHMRPCIERINEEFDSDKEAILANKITDFSPGYPVSPLELGLSSMLQSIESDPFVPLDIRVLVKDLLENRLAAIRDVSMKVYGDYMKGLALGKIQPYRTVEDWGGLHNKMVDELRNRGCNVDQIEAEVHEIRKAIQRYFESFDPR